MFLLSYLSPLLSIDLSLADRSRGTWWIASPGHGRPICGGAKRKVRGTALQNHWISSPKMKETCMPYALLCVFLCLRGVCLHLQNEDYKKRAWYGPWSEGNSGTLEKPRQSLDSARIAMVVLDESTKELGVDKLTLIYVKVETDFLRNRFVLLEYVRSERLYQILLVVHLTSLLDGAYFLSKPTS